MTFSRTHHSPSQPQAQGRAHLTRSRLGALLAIVLAPFLLVVTACLEAPIGDPEKSRVDPRLSGVWLDKKSADEADEIWVFQPFDRRTYQVGCFKLKKPAAPQAPAKDPKADSQDHSSFMVFKGWLTEIGGKRFLCLEPVFQFSTERGMKPEHWFAFQLPVSIEGDSLALQLINGRKAGKTTKEIEDYIRRNSDNKEMLSGESIVLRRIDRSQYDDLSKRLSASGLRTD